MSKLFAPIVFDHCGPIEFPVGPSYNPKTFYLDENYEVGRNETNLPLLENVEEFDVFRLLATAALKTKTAFQFPISAIIVCDCTSHWNNLSDKVIRIPRNIWLSELKVSPNACILVNTGFGSFVMPRYRNLRGYGIMDDQFIGLINI